MPEVKVSQSVMIWVWEKLFGWTTQSGGREPWTGEILPPAHQALNLPNHTSAKNQHDQVLVTVATRFKSCLRRIWRFDSVRG